MEVGDLLFFGSVFFLLFYIFLSFCYAFSKELFFYITLRAWGIKNKARLSDKITAVIGADLRFIEFIFTPLDQKEVTVRQRVTSRTYNALNIGEEIEIIHLKSVPIVARIANMPKERAYFGYYSAFFIVLIISFYPIIIFIIFLVSIQAVWYLWASRKIHQ